MIDVTGMAPENCWKTSCDGGYAWHVREQRGAADFDHAIDSCCGDLVVVRC